MSINVFIGSMLRDEQGATAIEYGLIAAMLVIAIVGSLSAFANETNAMWTKVQTEVENAR